MQQDRHGITPFGSPPFGAEGFSCIKGMDPRGDRLWAESAKDAAQTLNQSPSPSNPDRASPQEMFTNKKGPFRVLPFLQEGFMKITAAEQAG